jgi:DNA-binding MarR family transcriptional regulator
MDRIDRIGEQWRAERPDLDVGALELVGRLLRVAELADAKLSLGLAGHGLQPGWFDLLAALRRSGSPFELSPTELMGATMLTSGGITKRLDRLVEARLVERRPDPTDRRSTKVRLTPRGRRVIDRALAAHVANEEQLLSALPAADRPVLDSGLRKLLESLETP